jgi:hypothetical protein
MCVLCLNIQNPCILLYDSQTKTGLISLKGLCLYNGKWCFFSVADTKCWSITQMNFRPQTDHAFFMVYRSAVFPSNMDSIPCNSQTLSRQTHFFYLLVCRRHFTFASATILGFVSYLYARRFVLFLFNCDASANVHVVSRLCVVHHCWGWWSHLVQNGQLCSQCFVYLLQSS